MPDAPIVTLRDVAARAGVSISTASRALSGGGDLGSATRRRVLTAATDLGYDRGPSPRGRPRSGDSRMIELILGFVEDEWTDTVTTAVRRAAFAHGYDLGLTLERDDAADDWPVRVAVRRPAGVILGLIRPTRAQLLRLRELAIPAVLLDPLSDPEGEVASVGTTDWQGGYDAGEHLAGTGLQRFAVVLGTPRFRFGKAREEGFRHALDERAPGAAVSRIDADWNDTDLTAHLRALFSSDRSPLGVFAADDALALAIYSGASRLGLSIPEDIGVVGFNDEPRCALAVPPLTTVHQPFAEMAARAVELVHEQRVLPSGSFERVEVPTRLIVRSSTRHSAG